MTEFSQTVEATLQESRADLLAYFERRVPDREDAADLLAELMYQAWRRADALPDQPERARMWLYTIARNVLANHRRAAGRRLALTEQVRRTLVEAAELAVATRRRGQLCNVRWHSSRHEHHRASGPSPVTLGPVRDSSGLTKLEAATS